MLRLAKCCRPVRGDPIVGYTLLGTGITILMTTARTPRRCVNILEARCTVVHPMVKNRFVVEVEDTQAL